MKMHTKFTFLGSLAILAASPLALADKDAGNAVATEVAVDVVTDTATTDPVIVEDNATDAGGTTDGTDGAVVEEGATDDGTTPEGEVVDAGGGEVGGEVIDPGTVEDNSGEGTVVPLDWIKRGGGDNPDVIFYNMIGGGPAPVFKGETSPVAKQIGPDDKATAIEGKENSGAPQLNREKKGPVALIKKGRVFLR